MAWLATKSDKTAICRLVRIDSETVGRIIKRVGDELLDDDRLNDLFEISIDEISWRKGHRYLTLVGDHRRRCIVWGTEGSGADAADRFFEELDPEIEQSSEDDADRQIGERASKLEAISLDMGPGYAKPTRRHAPQAVICIDPYHCGAARQQGTRRGPPRVLERAANGR